MGTLAQDEKTMQMKGYVRLANASGEEYEDAQTRLIVGKVHLLDKIATLAKRKHAYGSPIPEPTIVDSHFVSDSPGAMTEWSLQAIRADFSDKLGVLKPKEIK